MSYKYRVIIAFRNLILAVIGEEPKFELTDILNLIGERTDELKGELYPNEYFPCGPCYGYITECFSTYCFEATVDIKSNKQKNAILLKMIEEEAVSTVHDNYNSYYKNNG